MGFGARTALNAYILTSFFQFYAFTAAILRGFGKNVGPFHQEQFLDRSHRCDNLTSCFKKQQEGWLWRGLLPIFF